MITGAHAIIYSRDAEADRRFLREVLKFPHVDAGHGWLIFGLPPAEVAVHPADDNDQHELYLMCDDVQQVTRTLQRHNIECSALEQQPWGLLTHVSLPGGGRLGLYQPNHPRPRSVAAAGRRRTTASTRRTAKRTAKPRARRKKR